jgi:predicted NUDIX family NTP pyrophosphohydrolase
MQRLRIPDDPIHADNTSASPAKSGRRQGFPETDLDGWLDLEQNLIKRASKNPVFRMNCMH